MRAEEYSAILKTRPLRNLEAAAQKARDMIGYLDILLEMEDAPDGPFPPSKAYETWKQSHHEEERRQHIMCLDLINKEIASRKSAP